MKNKETFKCQYCGDCKEIIYEEPLAVFANFCLYMFITLCFVGLALLLTWLVSPW